MKTPFPVASWVCICTQGGFSACHHYNPAPDSHARPTLYFFTVPCLLCARACCLPALLRCLEARSCFQKCLQPYLNAAVLPRGLCIRHWSTEHATQSLFVSRALCCAPQPSRVWKCLEQAPSPTWPRCNRSSDKPAGSVLGKPRGGRRLVINAILCSPQWRASNGDLNRAMAPYGCKT